MSVHTKLEPHIAGSKLFPCAIIVIVAVSDRGSVDVAFSALFLLTNLFIPLGGYVPSFRVGRELTVDWVGLVSTDLCCNQSRLKGNQVEGKGKKADDVLGT
uniref:Uncharacterized protein n=1 Tax=Nelumbo nucifera TaxID=4432 RepID=A0A822YAM0_NELNU|nr:TPA_asm: hypothetical protein HUJ06_030621 [Nelumbo nucifera]